MAKRVRRSGQGGQIDVPSIESNTYSEKSGARKNIPAGWVLKSVILAASAAAGVEIQPGTNLAFYNNSASVAYVGFYNSGSPIVPGSTNSQAVPPNSYAYFNSGMFNSVIVSAATCLAYIMDDETFYNTSNQ